MIIWLSSYPKSGNTWVRLFLDSLLFSKNSSLNINNIKIEQFPNRKHFSGITNNIDIMSGFVKNCIHTQSKLNLDNKIKFLKTHNAFWNSGSDYFSNNENTLGTIYIVRDPRNVITSIKNHYNKNSYDEALEFMKNEKKILGSKDKKKEEYDLLTPISSWGAHYRSWKKMKKNYLLIKYENLLESPNSEFLKIIKFLENCSNLRFSEKDMYEAIKKCEFHKLKNQEKENGFVESPKNKKFFFLGPENNWKKILDLKTQKKIETSFKKEMSELNYI